MWFDKKKEQLETRVNAVTPRSRKRTANSDMRSELGLVDDETASQYHRSNHDISDKNYNEEVILNDLKVRARRRMIGAFVLLAAAFVILPWVFDADRKQTAPVVSVVVPERGIKFEVQNPKRMMDLSVANSADNLKPVLKNSDAPIKVNETPRKIEGTQKKFVVHIGLVSSKEQLDGLKSRLQAKGAKVNTEIVKAADGSRKTRVRLGPFDSKTSAQIAADSVKGTAKNPIVIEVK